VENEETQPSIAQIPSDESCRLSTLSVLLTEELETLNHEQQRQGWSRWLLLVGSAYIAWLLIDVLETLSPRVPETLLLLTCILMGLTLTISFSALLCVASDGSEQRRGFRKSRDVFNSSTGGKLAVPLAAPIFWLCSLILHSRSSGSDTLWVAIAFSVVLFVVVVAVILLIRVESIPIPESSRLKGPQAVVSTVVWLVFGAAATSQVAHRLFTAASISVSEWRAALLLLGLLALLHILMRHYGREHTVRDELMSLRREIRLGEIGWREARERADFALRGIPLPQALGEPFGELLAINTARLQILARIGTRFTEMESLVATHAGTSESKLLASLDALGKDVDADVQEWGQQSEKLEKLSSRLTRKIALLAGLFPGTEEAIADLFEDVQSSFSAIENVAKENTERLARIRKKISDGASATV